MLVDIKYCNNGMQALPLNIGRSAKGLEEEKIKLYEDSHIIIIIIYVIIEKNRRTDSSFIGSR